MGFTCTFGAIVVTFSCNLLMFFTSFQDTLHFIRACQMIECLVRNVLVRNNSGGFDRDVRRNRRHFQLQFAHVFHLLSSAGMLQDLQELL
jgi:hypothetical protein